MEIKRIYFVKRNEKGFMELFECVQRINPVENSRCIEIYDTPCKVYPFEEDHLNVIWLRYNVSCLRYKVKRLKDELLKMQLKYEPLPLRLDQLFI